MEGGSGGSGGQGGCERKIEVSKKKLGGGGQVGGRVGGQVGCERRIEVFVKIQKKTNWEGGGEGVGSGGKVGLGWSG